MVRDYPWISKFWGTNLSLKIFVRDQTGYFVQNAQILALEKKFVYK